MRYSIIYEGYSILIRCLILSIFKSQKIIADLTWFNIKSDDNINTLLNLYSCKIDRMEGWIKLKIRSSRRKINKVQIILISTVLISYLLQQVIHAKVIYHFTLDFKAKLNSNTCQKHFEFFVLFKPFF